MLKVPSLISRFIVALVAVCAGLCVSAATVATSQGAYVAGADIVVSYSGPGNATDWLALYPADAIPGSNQYLKYEYVADASRANGQVTFAGGLPTPGNYVVFFYENDGYRLLASDSFSVIAADAPLVQTSAPSYQIETPITINFERGPGNPRDRIALYPAGVTPAGTPPAFLYVDGTTTGDAGLAQGSVTFADGVEMPGQWTAYLLENDSLNVLAQTTFDVTLPTQGLVRLQTDHSVYAPGQPVRVTFEGGPGDPQDWVGVYLNGQIPGEVNSTDWRYVNDSQTSGEARTTGEVTMDAGFFTPGTYRVFFLLNDFYEIAGEATFTVAEPGIGFVQTSKQIYNPNEAITVNYTNASGFPTDWVAIYPSGIIPDGTPSATLWRYTEGALEGSMTFAEGLPAGDYTVFLLENDGYSILAQENFSVRATGPQPVALLSTSPANNEVNVLASPQITAVFENRDTDVNTGSITLTLDPGTPNARTLTPAIATAGDRVNVTATVTQILAANSAHTLTLAYSDNTGQQFSSDIQFTVGDVVGIDLPTPIFFENFDSTAEGSVPSGWTVSNQSDSADIPADLHHLGSAAYNNFTVVAASRLGGNFIAYNDQNETTRPIADILSRSDDSYVVNGQFIRDFASGNILLGVSGYHSGANQILEAITPSINLSARADVHLSFHSLLQQNQDSIAGIEVSVDGGTTWSPVVYYLDPPDIIRLEGGAIDADTTFNTVRNDIAVAGAEGGYYGYFLRAPIDQAAAAATQPRLDNSPTDGTRVELIRVPQADNQANVKFRIFYAGTDSWYFGLDNFGVYSITDQPDAEITYTRDGSSLTLNWPALPGYVLQSTTTLSPPSWSNVEGVTGNTYTTSSATGTRFFRLFKP